MGLTSGERCIGLHCETVTAGFVAMMHLCRFDQRAQLQSFIREDQPMASKEDTGKTAAESQSNKEFS